MVELQLSSETVAGFFGGAANIVSVSTQSHYYDARVRRIREQNRERAATLPKHNSYMLAMTLLLHHSCLARQENHNLQLNAIH